MLGSPVGDVCAILGSVAGLLTITGVILKYIVRSEIRNEISSMRSTVDGLPEMIHEQVEDHLKPIERRQRMDSGLVNYIAGALAARSIVDSGELAVVRERLREDSAQPGMHFHHRQQPVEQS